MRGLKHRERRRALAAAVIAVALGSTVLVGCGAPAGALHVVLVDRTESAALASFQQRVVRTLEIVADQAVGSRGRLLVVAFGANPRDLEVVLDADLAGKGPSQLFRRADAAERRRRISAAIGPIANGPPLPGGSSVIGALKGAIDIAAAAGGGRLDLVAITDGEEVGDGLDLRVADLSSPERIADVIDLVASRGLIPDGEAKTPP